MQDRRAAKRYAKALFNAALKQDLVRAVDDDLERITAAIAGSDKFREFLKRPSTSDKDKLAVFEKTFADKVTALTMGFVRLVIQKRRDEEIFAVRIEYADLRRNHESVSKAVIASASELDDKQKSDVVAKFEQITKRKLDPHYVVDPTLMGGVKVTFDNFVLDGTVKGQLQRLKERMLYDLLKQA